jgi:hypothetical protein
MKTKNTPYKKEYKNGILSNPIETEFKNKYPNRRSRRNKVSREFSNKKGIQLVVTSYGIMKFIKTYKNVISKKGGAIINYTYK